MSTSVMSVSSDIRLRSAVNRDVRKKIRLFHGDISENNRNIGVTLMNLLVNRFLENATIGYSLGIRY